MAEITFIDQLKPMLRLIGKVPEKLERYWPGNGWVKAGKIKDENVKRLHLLQRDLTSKAAKARSRGDIASAHELQMKAETCEKILYLQVYQLLGLFGRFIGIPVIYGKWGVAVPRQSEIRKPD
ncbi:MAG: hypothetical protein QMD77_02245 [Patescibacteria group bacterium]|nr:hypothetical protein [Patescibacteria group bacterium]